MLQINPACRVEARQLFFTPESAGEVGFSQYDYVADAIDYQQKGIVYRYSPEGELLDEFRVGIIPGAFCWY